MPQTPAAPGKFQNFKVVAAQKGASITAHYPATAWAGDAQRSRQDMHQSQGVMDTGEGVEKHRGGSIAEEGMTCTYAFRLRQKARAQA